MPKFLPDAEGNPGKRNTLAMRQHREEMGIHGNATCVMNYDGATGFLIGEENRGLNAMFVMMNEARLGVGMQGLAISEIAIRTPPPTPASASGPVADRCQGAREEGRSDHRPSRCPSPP